MQKKDRRKYIRLAAYHLVKYKSFSAEKEQSHLILATLKDVGSGGVCLRTEEYLPVSSLIELRINFPNVDTCLYALAKVIWVKKSKSRRYEIGAQFVEIEESLRRIIDEHIKLACAKIKDKKRWIFKIFFKKGGKSE